MVEAAETLFVPLAIYNNTEGDADEAILKRYEEPAWNYQVVRIVDAHGENLVPRLAKDWTVAAVTKSMIAGLRAAEREVPAWLELVAAEERAHVRGVESAVFGMP